MRRLPIVVAFLALAACRSNTSREDELLAADRQFCADTQSQRIDGWIAAFDEHGSQFDDEFRPITGHAAIRAHMRDLFVDPAVDLTWEPDGVVVSEAGNLGSTTGRWMMTRLRDDGVREITATGRYFDVWRRFAGAQWKLVVDIGEPDLAPVAPRARDEGE